MTATTLTPSAYPPSVDDLLPRARTLAATVGEVPSRNRLKRELRIGAPKADVLREILTAELATAPAVEPTPAPADPPALPADPPAVEVAPDTQATVLEGHPVDPGANITSTPPAAVTEPALPVPAVPRRPMRSWPVWVLAAPAFVAIWSGWVGLGTLTGFGTVHPLPGIWDSFSLNTAITLPIGMETYAAFAIRVWLSGHVPARARRFAKWSTVGSLVLGAAGQIAYHLMEAASMTSAPWPITTVVSCLPLVVFGMAAALAHLIRTDHTR